MAKVFLICGKICSGKSTYAKQLQAATDCRQSPGESRDFQTVDKVPAKAGIFYTFSRLSGIIIIRKAVLLC